MRGEKDNDCDKVLVFCEPPNEHIRHHTKQHLYKKKEKIFKKEKVEVREKSLTQQVIKEEKSSNY